MKTKKLKLIQRALAALLTITMVLGIVPMTAFAEETSQTAQEAAAMRALESRVFTVGEEQLTIEDLEKATAVIMEDANGELVTVAGNEIRNYMLSNSTARAVAQLQVSLENAGQQDRFRIRAYVTSSVGIKQIKADNIGCWSTLKTFYKGFASITVNAYSSTSATLTSSSFYYPTNLMNNYRIYYDSIAVFFTNNRSEGWQNPVEPGYQTPTYS